MQLARTPQPHLPLRRVHVEIDHLGIDLDEQVRHRVQATRQELAVPVLHRLDEPEVGDPPPVEIDVDPRPVATGQLRARRQRCHSHALATAVHAGEVGRVQSRGRCRPIERRPGRHSHDLPAIDGKLERDLRVRKRLLQEGAPAQRRLRATALQETAPGRKLEEQRTHLRSGARDSRARPHALVTAETHQRAVCRGSFFPSGGQREHAAGADARKRLAPKPQRAHACEVAVVGDLGGGVPERAQAQILFVHAGTVVHHANLLQPSLDDFHPHVGGAGIDGVVEQLADDRVRPVDDFSGGDLPSRVVCKDADSAHGQECVGFTAHAERPSARRAVTRSGHHAVGWPVRTARSSSPRPALRPGRRPQGHSSRGRTG